MSLANKKGTKVIKLTCSVSCISATLSEYVLFSPPNSGRSTVDVLGLEFASGVDWPLEADPDEVEDEFEAVEVFFPLSFLARAEDLDSQMVMECLR